MKKIFLLSLTFVAVFFATAIFFFYGDTVDLAKDSKIDFQNSKLITEGEQVYVSTEVVNHEVFTWSYLEIGAFVRSKEKIVWTKVPVDNLRPGEIRLIHFLNETNPKKDVHSWGLKAITGYGMKEQK